ncbi:MAG: Alanyl-tRNA synthetase family protein [Labilithrix sp.]|nr:Alanyl-tRNA synthetase family protein [Labilithrix sp.]
MNHTEKLYWADAQATSFETRGASLGAHAGKPSVVLAQTMFYPEGGGQLGDLGTLTLGPHVVRIADTQVEDGAIHHVIDGDLSPDVLELLRGGAAADVSVRGAVDESRRRDHMVQHTAQHALSRALANAARAGTVSARLGATSCTIDLDRPGLSDADLHRAEDLVNSVVMSDVPVVTSFPSPDELAKLDLRKQPNAEKSAAGVRVVSIEGFDVTPCGGTHCTRSGQIGQVRIVATEKYKGMLRITFHAGQRALGDARSRHDLLAKLAADLTCGPQDIPAAVAKLRAELKAMRDKLESARSEVADHVGRSLRDALPETPGPHVVPVMRLPGDLAGLRALAVELTKDPRIVALVAGHDEGSGEVVLVVQRGEGAKLDCGAFVQSQTKARGGRGGGRPERAEGRFPRGTSLEELTAAARESLAV